MAQFLQNTKHFPIGFVLDLIIDQSERQDAMHLTEAKHEPKDATPAPVARYYTTGDLLDMITALRDHDPGAASHTLVGLLRMACEGIATPVEQTALRIAGLAEIEGQELNLTRTAYHLLGRFSSGEYEGDVKSGRIHADNDDTEAEKSAADIISEQSPELIARLRIGGVDYMIGEIPAMEMLVFHRMDDPDSEWKNLNNTVEEGWSQVAAEIIAQTRDTTREYIRMHMIHRRNINAGDNIRLFDLYGFEWYLRTNEDETVDVTLSGREDWSPVDLEGINSLEDEIGEVAVRALLIALPEAREHFSRDISDWSRRIAAGASVMPAFNL